LLAASGKKIKNY